MKQTEPEATANLGQRKLFMTIGVLESYSYLLLLGVAMPLKYLAGMPWAVRYVGMAHGLLFVLYMVALLRLAISEKLNNGMVLKGAAASLLPLGPHWFNGQLKKRWAS